MFLAADGQDGSGLQLEKVGPTFSSCTMVVLKLWFTLLLSIHLISFTLGTFFLDYSRIGLLGIDGIRVLLGAIPFSE